MAAQIKEFINEGLVNIVGGCCGTTPEHIARYREITQNASPRRPIAKDNRLHICGLEDLVVCPENNFVNIRRTLQRGRLSQIPEAHSRKELHRSTRHRTPNRSRPAHKSSTSTWTMPMLDARKEMVALLESHRLRARHLSGSCNDRLFRMGGSLRRLEMSARESHRQLHQPERRRRNIPRACP